MQTQTIGDTPHYFRTANRAKRSRKFNAEINKKTHSEVNDVDKRRHVVIPFTGVEGCRGLMVKASGWQSFDRQFDPYPRAIKVAPLWCSLGCRSESDGRIHQ
jgi:hypothetical protein